MADQIGSGTAAGLVEYLNSLVAKGRARQGAIAPLRISFSKVLSAVDGDNWERTDIREINVDDYLLRFANLTNGHYNTDSLRVYGMRTRKAIRWYLTFLKQPGWVPEFKATTVPKEGQAIKLPKKQQVKQQVPASEPEPQMSAESTVPSPESAVSGLSYGDGLIAYPFPLMTGKLVTLYLPVTIQKIDAQRLSAFLQTLVVEGGVTYESTDTERQI